MVASFIELIEKKRDGETLNEEDIELFVNGVTNGEMKDHQLGAMLMAMYINGLGRNETNLLTKYMMKSGQILQWPDEWKGLVVDKHSTGGVGDKISLILAPALAACGLKVPMISGRGLGYTGGTLDKLESIPGYDVYQSCSSMRRILDEVGCCIVGQTESLVPADKKLYAIRDVTGTVNAISLITASIMSKKCAENLDALLLDVKVGSGAMMREERKAQTLAKRLCDVGNEMGIKVTCILSNMEYPIGHKIGNSLEILETLECLRGEGPTATRELVEIEGGYLLYNVGKAFNPEEGRQLVAKSLQDGRAMSKFYQLLRAQGVSEQHSRTLCAKHTDVFSVLPKAKLQSDIPALETGYVSGLDALTCAKVSCLLGAGRTKAGQPLDHAVGLDLHIEVGSHVIKDKPWVTVHHNNELSSEHIEMLQKSLLISQTPPAGVSQSLILGIIQPGN